MLLSYCIMVSCMLFHQIGIGIDKIYSCPHYLVKGLVNVGPIGELSSGGIEAQLAASF